MNFIQITKLVVDFWPIVLWIGATIVGGILFYASIQNRFLDHDGRISILEKKDETLQALNSLVIAIDAKLTVLLPDYKGK